MAEHSIDDPVWDSDVDHMGPVDLDELGISEQLARRLRAWNAQYNAIALTDYEFPSEEAEMLWEKEGLELAYKLQNELPDIEISYEHDTDPRPLRARRGP